MRREDQIKSKLEAAFSPAHMTLVNESARHHGHAGDDGSGESHFSLTIVSDAFAGKSRVERQRMIYAALDSEFKAGLHALSIKTSSTKE